MNNMKFEIIHKRSDRNEKARLKKIHDELVTSGHDFDGWQHTKYDLTGIPDKAIGLVVAERNKRP